jgi:hypothetical protein
MVGKVIFHMGLARTKGPKLVHDKLQEHLHLVSSLASCEPSMILPKRLGRCQLKHSIVKKERVLTALP